jgi:hypothetical protein
MANTIDIDISRMAEAELLDLNRRIVERIRFLQQMRTSQAMMEFCIGDRVAFYTDNNRLVTGTVTKYNKKTVTILTDCGHRWRVSPGLLMRRDPKSEELPSQSNLPHLPR